MGSVENKAAGKVAFQLLKCPVTDLYHLYL